MHDVTHPCLTHDSSLHDWILSHPTSHGCQTNLHGCHIPVLTAWMAMDKHARVSTDAVATRCKIILTISVSQSQLLFLPYRCITVQLHRQGTLIKSSKSTNQHQSTMTDEPLSIHGELHLFSLTLHVKNTRVISPVSHHTTRVAPLDETNYVQAVAPQSLRRSSSQPAWYRTTQQQTFRHVPT